MLMALIGSLAFLGGGHCACYYFRVSLCCWEGSSLENICLSSLQSIWDFISFFLAGREGQPSPNVCHSLIFIALCAFCIHFAVCMHGMVRHLTPFPCLPTTASLLVPLPGAAAVPALPTHTPCLPYPCPPCHTPSAAFHPYPLVHTFLPHPTHTIRVDDVPACLLPTP